MPVQAAISVTLLFIIVRGRDEYVLVRRLSVGWADAGPTAFLVVADRAIGFFPSEEFCDTLYPFLFEIALTVVSIRAGAERHVLPFDLLETTFKLRNLGENVHLELLGKIASVPIRYQITAEWAGCRIVCHIDLILDSSGVRG